MKATSYRYVATNAILPTPHCVCGARHRDAYPALCCYRSHREMGLTVRCVVGEAFAAWPIDSLARFKRYFGSLGLSIEEVAPTLHSELRARAAQQTLALDEPKPRSGAAWLTKANSYK